MRKMRTALLGIGTAALIAGGTVSAGAAQPAADTQAKPAATQKAPAVKAWKKCPVGAVCLYTKPNGQGTVYKIWANTNKNYRHISSMWNNGDTSHPRDHARIKWNSGHGDKWFCMVPGKRSSGNDYTVDAVRWRSGC